MEEWYSPSQNIIVRGNTSSPGLFDEGSQIVYTRRKGEHRMGKSDEQVTTVDSDSV